MGIEVELEIVGINSKGQGISRLPDGKVIFVNEALPGETVVAKVSLQKKKYAVGKIVEIRRSNEHRISPLCPLFGKCGGCQLQHCSYDLQLEIKRNILVDSLERIGHLHVSDIVEKCESSPKEWHYRNKASFPVRKKGNSIETGFFRMGSHNLVPVSNCPVIENPLNELLSVLHGKLKELKIPGYDEKKHSGTLRHIILRSGSFSGEFIVTIVLKDKPGQGLFNALEKMASEFSEIFPAVNGVIININSEKTNRIIGNRSIILSGNNYLTEMLADKHLEYESTSFFQVNSYQALKLFSYVRDHLSSRGLENLLELYSGAGALTVFLADRAKKVCAVESWHSSVKSMKTNLAINGLTNVTIREKKAEELLSGLRRNKFSSVVLDPPRSGCNENVLDYIASSGISEIIYVSCNPSTLARDCSILAQKGYVISRIRPFDMFPQTCHVEAVVLMRKK